MAAEVPVSDVLCEAMEYLSKLGSNLRTRSENLKEKRICKSKLKNAHAVQKAANKVLLICELSKKSLDNVETGVRKVLSMLEASQASSSIGGNTADTNRRCKQYHYIEYQSRKLRIAKKISLKHYTSVKVLAKQMPGSMQDKYPVYYDCKLKRQRRRLTKKQELELISKNTASLSDKEQENEESGTGEAKKLDDCCDLDKKSDHEIENNNSQKHVTDSENPIEGNSTMTDHTQEENEITMSNFLTENNENQNKNKAEKDSKVNSITSASIETRESPTEKCSDSESNTDKKYVDKISQRKSKDHIHNRNKYDKESNKKNKRSKTKFAAIYSSDSDTKSIKDKSENIVENEVNLCSGDDSENSSIQEPKSKKVRLHESDDEFANNNSNGVAQHEMKENNCENDEVEEKITDIDGSDKDVESDNDSLGTKSSKDSRNDSGTESKPIIRCVNLSKLLKPDMLHKEISHSNVNNKPERSKKNECAEEKIISNRKQRDKKDEQTSHQRKIDDEFWIQKRKEVKEFKPKTLSVNLSRLPSFSENFLHVHKLQRIVKKGYVICEITSDTNTLKKIDEVKNELLNDSDSNESSDTNKVKRSLLKDSDSEHDISEKEESSETNKSSRSNKQKEFADSIKSAISSLDSNLENIEEQFQQIETEATNSSQHNNMSSTHNDISNKSTNEDSDSIESNKQSICAAKSDGEESSILNNKSDKKETSESNDENNVLPSNNLPVNAADCSENDEGLSTTIEGAQGSLLSTTSDEKSAENDVIPKDNEEVKSCLLNNSSDEDFCGFSKNDQESPTKVIDKVKSSLLNDSSDDDFTGFSKNVKQKSIENNQGKVLNVSSDVILDNNGAEPSTNIDDNQQSPLTKNVSDDNECTQNDKETPTKTNEKVKSSLLNDSSDEKSNKSDQESTAKNDDKIKSCQNESSNNQSDEPDKRKEKQKTPKSKRKLARKIREAKQKLRYDSSSDGEQEKNKRKHTKKKVQIVSSTSSSEDTSKKVRKSSESNHSDYNTARVIDQVDGPMDEQSNSSVDKMVRSKAKPSGSSSQNSDNQDATDKDIEGLTNLNNLNKNRRRDHSAKSREGTDSSKKNNESKDTPIIGEDLLKAESSSEVSDVPDNDFEELPPVTVPGLNGDGVDHMAKDDLLGESDSSISHNDKDQTENTDNLDETDGEENLKLKRRKANAISSDSEGGSNRHKPKDEERMSDFEDSEDESSEPAKKSKRKKKSSESDASVDSNDGGKKKRRRIKVVRDSDVSGSDTENEGRNKHGRKNIRKVMGKNQLEEATKKAAREEKERIARITERQKLYNNLDFDESGKPDEVVLEKVVLDFDPETKEPLIQVDRGLVKKLKPHQANGIKFMWDACFESVKRIKKDKGSGCILAHCMGLGKTLQVISLTHTLLTHSSLTGVNRVLVVCPLSTVLNWVNEFRMWLKHAEAEFDVDVYELSRYKQNSERAFQLQQWLDGGGVCVLGYEMFRNLSADNTKKFKKKMLRSFQESLVDPGPDLVVCDEGHLLKNEKTSLSQSMNRVKTRRRIVLTGTPLQNNLKEYYCMVQFVKPNLLGKYNEYLNRFVNPITNGQYTDSTEHDIRVMKRRSHVLHKMLDGAVQRRDYGVLAPFLPPKHEYVLFITLTDVQVKLYQFYLDNYSRRPLPGKSSGFLFPDFQSLQRIWTHPLVLKYNSERYEIMQQKKREREEEDSEGSLVDFIDDDSTPEETSTEESSDDLSDMSDDSRKKSKKKKSTKKSKGKETKASTRRGTRANPVELDDEDNDNDDVVEVKNENPTEWWIKLVEETELEDMRNSHKLVLLFDILRQCETIGDKLLVFSQSLYSLDLIEHFLGKVDEATQEGRIDEKLGGHVGSWSPGVDYFRLDGSTSCENRSIWCKNFNREDNPRARLFLISTRAGGLGINLVAANRVVIFDVSWNPSHDVQSIFRVYRFGQKKPCYIYRFLAMGTMEEKIYERQVTKQAISKRVIDEQQIDRHYAENDLAELYKFDARPIEPRPLPTLPKDRLFAEMLKEHEAQIYKYHEHDSLLENKEEETLSEEERKAAWEDFENEKNKPPPAPFPSAWPMHNGMVPGLLAQQQQQLAYAALAAMLRKDMPNINDNQIRDMLPLIYNSNPGMFGGYDYGLMQKMSEIYKYAQPSMMNPGMMNPVMNAGSGGGGMGGTSGLQYEPPWQRQHQQQQQMRLQQLMQQQNQMGAKFYAGGLGSRDPVAMALQQQRAREIMMGGGGAPGARPRGRPPAHPRLPTTTSSDVVNLDSD